ncbi:MAG: hypothetical protein IKQ72_11590 [Bacteroidaceae bacterium]|nr:hypothetical protein [Bacteroidaceae bacterium]
MNNVKDYKCFIASPGDTKEERDLCEEVFNEINNGIGKNLGFQLSSLRWEKDVYSSIGDYGQDVINKQIDAKYDFFIGIMKSRFGTPTPTAGSGTEEEFNNAFEKYRNGEIDNIFFFFGNTKESLNDIDPDQFKHVLEFKKRIHNQGLLSMEYVGLEDFKQKLRRNFENYFTDKKNRKRKVAKQDDKALICARTVSYDYRKLWETAMTLLHKNDSTQHIYTLLTKSKNRFCKIIFSQEHIVNHLMTNEPLTKEKAELFALAVSDIGQLPSYYNNCHKDDTELNKQSLWIQLKEREKSLSGSTELIYTTDDTSTYEQIQRCLFHLDFSKSKALVNSWNPKNFWVQHKAMRMAVYPELYNSSRVLLKKAIATETNSTEKFYEIILANYISSEWPRPFSIDEFLKYGLEGQGDLLNSMMANLRGKEEKPKRRGWIGSTHYLGDNNGDYCKSLRILQFIVDSGIYLNLQGTYMFEVASWYKVFTNLYEHFPYPCFFYSIQYADRDVLRRIGEDYAYNEGLQAFVQDILLKSMSSIANGDTPPLFRNGILHVTAAMYIAVDEYIWFDLFVETVFAEFCREIKSGYNELEFNVKLAIGSLKGTDHIKNVFIRLLSM